MLDVCLPGTGGVIPLEDRSLSCCWLEYQGQAVLIDCGEGTQVALKKSGCKLSRLNLLLFTHYHADHAAGLPGLLLTLGNSGKTSPLTIAGPPGLMRVVGGLCVVAPTLPYPLELVELKDEPSAELSKGGLNITWLPLRHGIPCLGYRIALYRKPIFNPQKAEALGIPKPFYRTLHSGQPVTLEDGRTIEPSAVLDGERPPLRVCFCTDTRPVPTLREFVCGADLMIGEGMYGDDEMEGAVKDKGHMLFSDSARIARDAGVKRLWLTHFSPAMRRPGDYIGAARAVFPESTAAYDGIRMSLGCAEEDR